MGESLHGFHNTLIEWNKVDAIMMVVDQLFELVKMAPKKTIVTFYSTKLFFDMWVRHHGMLQFIVSDKMPSLWQAYKNICFERWAQIFHLI
jgi:hypothetical protein